MKKLLIALLTMLLALGMTCALAEEKPVAYTCGDFEYILLEDGSAEITDYTGQTEDLEIPPELDGHRVSAIGPLAFLLSSELSSVIIPEGVTTIGMSAFELCSALSSVTLPESLTTIHEKAFGNCHSLTSIVLPDSLTTLQGDPFTDCTALTDIIISPEHPVLAVIDGVLYDKVEQKLLCYPAFRKRASFTVPEGIRIIGSQAFFNRSLTSVTLPEGVVSIEDNAFAFCSLTSISLPGSLETIGTRAFASSKLSRITIPEGVTSIGENAFTWCLDLHSITLPASLTFIGDGAIDSGKDSASVTIWVPADSYAAQWCEARGLRCRYDAD